MQIDICKDIYIGTIVWKWQVLEPKVRRRDAGKKAGWNSKNPTGLVVKQQIHRFLTKGCFEVLGLRIQWNIFRWSRPQW